MDQDQGLLLTALTLVLAKQIRAEKAANGQQVTTDPINEAVALVKGKHGTITGKFGGWFI